MKSVYFLIVVAVLLTSCSAALSADTVATSVAGTVVALQPAQQEQVSSPAVPQATSPIGPTPSPAGPTRTSIPPTWDMKAYKTQVALTEAAKPTRTPLPTRTPGPTATPLPPTETPNAATQTAVVFGPLIADKYAGIYLINVDIAPGVWRNNGQIDSCYWKRSDRYGNIIDNFFGLGGGTIYIAPSDFQVQLDQDCGMWTYIGPP